jgi:hypothetical protein
MFFMKDPRQDARQLVRRWSEAHQSVVVYDDESAILRDVTSGKGVKLWWRDVNAFEEKRHPETHDTYVVLLFENGMQLALVDPGGVAFAPIFDNSGRVEQLPAIVCLRDFFTLKQRIDHYLHDHRDEEPPRESLDLVMSCIAILDGARGVGFDVGDLESELEITLSELERRRTSG